MLVILAPLKLGEYMLDARILTHPFGHIGEETLFDSFCCAFESRPFVTPAIETSKTIAISANLNPKCLYLLVFEDPCFDLFPAAALDARHRQPLGLIPA